MGKTKPKTNNTEKGAKPSSLFTQRVLHGFKSAGFSVCAFFKRINEFFSRIRARYLVIGSAAFDLLLVAVILLELFLPNNKAVNSSGAVNSERPIYQIGTEDDPTIDSSRLPHNMLLDNLLEDDEPEQKLSVEMQDKSPLEYGMEEKRVEVLQIALKELGFLDIDETTTYFGPATRSAVKVFQRQHDLEQTGNADTKTLEMIFSGDAEIYVLSEGDEGEDVHEIQRQLMDLAYMDKATGYYGDQTIQAVKDFQKRNSLKATGKVDKETRELLYMPDAVEGENYAVKTRRRAKILTFVEVAKNQIGKRYSLGSTGPNAFDCSGLVYYCLREAGSNRRRLSADGYSHVDEWEKITSMHDLEIGDLLFYHIDSRTRIGHVGIYVGGGKMIDASFSGGKVVKRSIWEKYWTTRFAFARRPW